MFVSCLFIGLSRSQTLILFIFIFPLPSPVRWSETLTIVGWNRNGTAIAGVTAADSTKAALHAASLSSLRSDGLSWVGHSARWKYLARNILRKGQLVWWPIYLRFVLAFFNWNTLTSRIFWKKSTAKNVRIARLASFNQTTSNGNNVVDTVKNLFDCKPSLYRRVKETTTIAHYTLSWPWKHTLIARCAMQNNTCLLCCRCVSV